MSYFIDKNPLENHLKVTLSSEEIYPKTGDYTKISIYRDPFRFYVPAFGLSPNVMVRGIYFGTDKLTHFSSTGRRYFKHYLKELKSSSDQEAQRSAILFGLRNEASILGYWSSGVFSYGDMEANYQGLLFYKQLCFDEHDSFIVQNPRGDWKLVRKPDIRNYVSPLWDETFNLSYRLPENWVKVAKVLKQDYCSLASEPAVQERMNYYRRFEHTSFSRDFIKELQARGFKDAPIPEATQSFEELCQGPLFSPNI